MESKHIKLIPMAGAGQRFVDAGYGIPKPLIEIHGKPMVVRATDCLPKGGEYVFVCQDKHIEEDNIDASLKRYYDKVEVLSVDHLTEGQACTCLLAKQYIDNENFLTIGACDNAMTYEKRLLEQAFDEEEVDAWIWTFRNNPSVLQNPKMYGWVRVKDDNLVEAVSCKQPISDSVMKDHAIIGCFTFRRGSDFIKSAESMIQQNRRINNEFYVDVVMDVAVQLGMKVKVFEVEQYICWGTPSDLETYHCWHNYFSQSGLD